MSVLRRKRGLPAVLLRLVLAACGGGPGGNSSGCPVAVTPEKPASRDAAARFLTQATFGPTEADIERVMAVGYAAWIDEQFAKPVSSHRATWEAADAAVKAANAANDAGPGRHDQRVLEAGGHRR